MICLEYMLPSEILILIKPPSFFKPKGARLQEQRSSLPITYNMHSMIPLPFNSLYKSNHPAVHLKVYLQTMLFAIPVSCLRLVGSVTRRLGAWWLWNKRRNLIKSHCALELCAIDGMCAVEWSGVEWSGEYDTTRWIVAGLGTALGSRLFEQYSKHSASNASTLPIVNPPFLAYYINNAVWSWKIFGNETSFERARETERL